MLKPEITITMFGRKKKQETNAPVEEPTVDYIAAAEEAAARLGKKLVVGIIVTSVATIAAATLGNIAIAAVESHLNK
jgi:hypothetical protein